MVAIIFYYHIKIIEIAKKRYELKLCGKYLRKLSFGTLLVKVCTLSLGVDFCRHPCLIIKWKVNIRNF